MRRATLAVAVLILVVDAVGFRAQSLPTEPNAFTGTWSVDGADGVGWTVTLRVNGADVSGVVSRCANSQAVVYDAHVDGNRISFKCQNADRSRTVSLSGELQQDALTFTWKLDLAPGGIPVSDTNQLFGRFAPKQFTARRIATAEMPVLSEVVGDEFAAAVNLPSTGIKVEADLFVPNTVTRVTAIIVATGFGRGFDFYEDQQVRRFAALSSCAIVLARLTVISNSTAGMVAENANNGGAESLVEALRSLAKESSHQEVADAPLLFWGHSGGGVFGVTFAGVYPQRTIAFVGYQGITFAGADADIVSKIPALVVTDKFNTAIDGSLGIFWTMGRSRQAAWAFVPQVDAPHGDLDYLKKANDLFIPWMAAVIRQRVSPGRSQLLAVQEESGWLGDNLTKEIAPYGAFAGKKDAASWLPDEASARGRRSIVRTSK